jgi:hypothetical protein
LIHLSRHCCPDPAFDSSVPTFDYPVQALRYHYRFLYQFCCVPAFSIFPARVYYCCSLFCGWEHPRELSLYSNRERSDKARRAPATLVSASTPPSEASLRFVVFLETPLSFADRTKNKSKERETQVNNQVLGLKASRPPIQICYHIILAPNRRQLARSLRHSIFSFTSFPASTQPWPRYISPQPSPLWLTHDSNTAARTPVTLRPLALFC